MNRYTVTITMYNEDGYVGYYIQQVTGDKWDGMHPGIISQDRNRDYDEYTVLVVANTTDQALAYATSNFTPVWGNVSMGEAVHVSGEAFHQSSGGGSGSAVA